MFELVALLGNPLEGQGLTSLSEEIRNGSQALGGMRKIQDA
jgi:hypothetical protein